MHSGADVRVVGAQHRTTVVARALATGGLHCRCLTPGEATRRPGSILGAHIIVWAFPPGSHPTIEAEGYASGAIGCYAHWGSESAEVGPITVEGAGPCPACLHASPAEPGDHTDPLLGMWAAALAALQCDALLRTGRSELIGASWRWRLGAPGLALARWPGRCDCRAVECGQL
nr:hypothetical protein [Tessaracoccus bendigoensis]